MFHACFSTHERDGEPEPTTTSEQYVGQAQIDQRQFINFRVQLNRAEFGDAKSALADPIKAISRSMIRIDRIYFD